MMSGYTTYDSITKRTTKEEDATGIPSVIILEEAKSRNEGLPSSAAARSVAALLVGILVGAAVLVIFSTTTTELSGGLGSMVSLRSSSSRMATDTLVANPNQARIPAVGQYMPLPGVPTPDLTGLLPGVGTPANIAWKNQHGISGTEGECHFCNYWNCATGIPFTPGDHPKCNRGKYQCPRYTNCGITLTTNGRDADEGDDKFAAVGSESQCQWCTYNKCGTGVPCRFGINTSKCARCNYNKCNVYTNCAQDYPPVVPESTN